MNLKNFLSIILLIISMANLNSQDYTLNFNGAGASNKIDTIIVKNLTQGTSMILYGNTVLHLKADLRNPTGINPPHQESEHGLIFSPNPMNEFSLMTFDMNQPGAIIIELYDVSGRKITQIQESLPSGRHTFRIEGLKNGIYFLRKTALGYSHVGKLLCGSDEFDKAGITYVNTAEITERINRLKSTSADSVMQYNSGDTLLMTFVSGDYKTTLSDVPETDKTITCNFYECRDFQNKNYPVVKIGNQLWMAENLKSTVLNDGTKIPEVTHGNEWCQLTSPAYCWYANDSVAYSNPYGPLYNWYTIKTGKLCPEGWHVPSNEEWATLVNYVGGVEIAGAKLKEAGTDHWSSPNIGMNSVGFSALPGGLRYGIVHSDSGNFIGVRVNGNWWTSSEYDGSIGAHDYCMASFIAWISAGCTTSFESGHNVRCIGPIIPIPEVSTANVTDITPTTGMCGGFIINDQDSAILSRGVCWSTRPEPDITDYKTIDDLETDSFVSNMTGLTANTVYYVRAYATNGSGTGYGKAISFKTKHDNEHFIMDMDGNEYDTVVIGDQIWLKENLKTTRYNDGTNIPKTADAEAGIFPETPSYAWHKNDSSFYKETYGALYNWYVVESDKLCPAGWHVPSDIEWSMLEDYLGGKEVAGGKMKEAGTAHWYAPNVGADNSSGFTALPGSTIGITGFWWSSSEIYGTSAWLRFLANDNPVSIRCDINKGGLNSIRCLKYPEKRVPVLITNKVDSISQTEASSGGKVIYDGGSQITSRGVCWNTSPNPEITGDKTMDRDGASDFMSQLTGLHAHTIYYIRAYATNESGTGYGKELTFTTLPQVNGDSIYNTDSVVDLDGNVYRTVKIGAQIWLAENLKTTRYNTGIEIPLVEDSSWGSLKTAAYCWYGNDSANYEKDYGKLYNWYAVNSVDLCPAGWHVPSEEEWLELINSLGGKNSGDGKLKESGFEHWLSPNTGATNESGFTALNGGFRNHDGSIFPYSPYHDIPYDGYWWSSSTDESDAPWCINLNYASIQIIINWCSKKAGFSVRCMGPGLSVPKLSTDSIVNITQTSATGWGLLFADLALNISSRGVCWSTNPNPDISDDKTSDGNGIGSIANSMSGLTPNTTYYVRAYVIYNSVVKYGNELTFATPSDEQ